MRPSKQQKQQQQHTRAALIFQVRSGQMTATQAARQLGISRQRYYLWEKRALQAMLQSLEERPRGRKPSRKLLEQRQKTRLNNKIKKLEKQLHYHQQKEKLQAKLKKLLLDKEPGTIPGSCRTKKNSKTQT